MNVICYFVFEMIKVGKGVVVNFSFGWGRSVVVYKVLYCVFKWVIEGFFKVMVFELFILLICVLLNLGVINIFMLEIIFGK